MNAAEFLLSLGNDTEKWAKFYADAIKNFYDTCVQHFVNDIQGYIDERIKQHTDNLQLWENGFLAPTEPDESERNAVKRELKAAISELEKIKEKLT